MSKTPEKLLVRFYKRKAACPRNSPFTFKEGDFYKTLKNRISEKLKSIPEDPANRSKFLTDSLLFGFISTALCATYLKSYILGFVSGILLSMLANAAHNFFHQKDNFRMFYFDLSLMSSRGWRVSHALSHHLYTNTVYDMEISVLEPFLQYLPNEKFFFFTYFSWIYSPIIYSFIFIGYFIRRFVTVKFKKNFFGSKLLIVAM